MKIYSAILTLLSLFISIPLIAMEQTIVREKNQEHEIQLYSINRDQERSIVALQPSQYYQLSASDHVVDSNQHLIEKEASRVTYWRKLRETLNARPRETLFWSCITCSFVATGGLLGYVLYLMIGGPCLMDPAKCPRPSHNSTVPL